MSTYFDHRPDRRADGELAGWLLALVAMLLFWGKIMIAAQVLHP